MIEYLPLVLTGIGIIASILYYASVLRNANTTRQAQLYMGLINTFNSLEFRTQWHLIESAKWEDYDDYHEKYLPGSDVLTAIVMHFTFFESIGGLVEKKLIDIDLIDGILAQAVVMTWRMYEQIIMGDRERFQTPSMWNSFEYLYNEINKRKEFTDTADKKPIKIDPIT
jgi:hypothetical protein